MVKRIDLVYKKLKELSRNKGVDAQTLADALELGRANVSSDLNKLCEEGKVKKTSGRPVLFMPSDGDDGTDEELSTLDRLIKENKSLTIAGEQAKAAILYPPRGMHTLILGETGVGKTMFAGIMYKYAIEMDKLPKQAPFITFNCADYSNNPQLLLSQLFGVKKGSYTGADSDRQGLIEKADGGILFLDEVHRLPAEGQEMFFTFMDKGTFRRLGETEVERRANVLIISATTENPESSLLKTFTRRIPMVIRVPGLGERGLEERFGLITNFFREESFRLDREIFVSVNSMRAFLSYNCLNNVGQLKTDIQLACAKAYADFLSYKKDSVKINSTDLPAYIREGLYKETEHRQIWNKLIGINNRYLVFNKYQEKFIFNSGSESSNIYEIIDSRMNELKSMGVDKDDLEKIMDKDIEDYFNQYLYGVNNRLNKTSLASIVNPVTIDVVDEIVSLCEKKLNRQISQKIYLGLAIHIEAAIDRVRRNKKIINPKLQKIRTEYCKEFAAALDCLSIIERAMDISMPIDEAGFIAMFLTMDNEGINNETGNIGVLVIAHGNATASSMAEVANKLLGVEQAAGINMPIDESPEQVLERIREHVKNSGRKQGFIFLVDMGSLTTFGKIIEREMGIPVETVPLVSTLHVLEAARKAALGCSLEETFNDVSSIANFFSDNEENEITGEPRFVILTVCTTGEGSAIAIKNFLQGHLKFDNRLFEILPINIVGREDINTRIKKICRDKELLCIVSPFNIQMEVPSFNLDDVLNLKAIKKIQEIIDIQGTYMKMGEMLKNHLENVDGELIFEDIKKCISLIEESLKIKIGTERLIGIALHISCMIDRLIIGGQMVAYPDSEDYISKNYELYNIVNNVLADINSKYKIDISKDEICYIMDFFNPENV